MPRNGSGVYSQPGGTAAVSGATITSSAYNTLIDDIGDEITASLPLSGVAAMTGALKIADGTAGAPSVQFSSAATTGIHKSANGIGISVSGALVAEARAGGLYDASGNAYLSGSAVVAWADVASASTTDIGAAASENLRITGTTTITAFGTIASGITRNLRFAGALTLTHNGTTLILPGAANITTAANDTCTAVSLGSGNWIVVDYQRASGLTITSEIPSQGGNSGKYLTTNGSATSWGTVTTGITSVATGDGLTGGPITSTGTVSIDTNNALGIGAYAILGTITGVNSGSTAAGSSLQPGYGSSADGQWKTVGSAPSGTWRNVSGAALGNSTDRLYGLWIRTA